MTKTKTTTTKTIMLCAGQSGRAVLIGEVSKLPRAGQPVTLRNARMVLYWASQCGGLLGLATRGPAGETRITAAVPATCETVWQEWIEMTPRAADGVARWPAC